MTFPIRFCPAAVLLLAVSACNYDLNERPEAGSAAPMAGLATPTSAPLRDVRWELRELSGQPAPTTEQRPFLLLHGGRTRAEGEAACNHFGGPFTLTATGQLRLGPLVTTRRACPDLATEGRFLKALNQTQHYRISGTTLSLYGPDTLGAPLARLEAVAAK